jgi:tetratricopeptide (TPR) repeat protein
MNILSYFFVFCLAITTVNAQIDPKCFEPKVQDSLETHYCERGAYRYSYNSKEWQVYLDSLIQICPNIANAYREKAIPDIKRGDWAKAMPLENKTVELDAKHWMDYRAFLKAIFTKDYEGAIIDFEAAEKLHPNDFVMDHSYSFYKGMCYLAMGKLEQAEILFKKDIAVQSSSKPHFNSLWYSGVVY